MELRGKQQRYFANYAAPKSIIFHAIYRVLKIAVGLVQQAGRTIGRTDGKLVGRWVGAMIDKFVLGSVFAPSIALESQDTWPGPHQINCVHYLSSAACPRKLDVQIESAGINWIFVP